MDYHEDTLRQLRNVDWENISLRLLKFAIIIGGNSVIAKGIVSQDTVKDTIAKTFQEKGNRIQNNTLRPSCSTKLIRR